jgi:hypothetical protein
MEISPARAARSIALRNLFCLGLAALPLLPVQASAWGSHKEDWVSEVTPQLQDGDIIFIRIANPFFREVAKTSQSWESHVGIAFRNSDGRWMVGESTIPVAKFTTLERFVKRSEDHRFMVKRLKGGLNAEEALKLREAALKRNGVLYHLGFKYDSSRMYCSKYVYDSYLEATGEKIGELQTFRELLEANPHAPVGFWRLWFLGSIPWDRRCVTTTSEIQSPRLVTVFDSTQAHVH